MIYDYCDGSSFQNNNLFSNGEQNLEIQHLQYLIEDFLESYTKMMENLLHKVS